MELETNLMINSQNSIEIFPKDIFIAMKNNTYNFYHQNLTTVASSQNYFSMKLKIIPLIKKISDKMNLKSQTFYLGLYYLDIIYSNNNQIQNLANKFSAISLTCLILSAKICENDPVVPSLKSFANAYNKFIDYKKIITVKELFYYEVFCLKLLKYKLSYCTVYDFNYFILGHGIVKKEQIEDLINSNISNDNILLIKKIQEKIYKKSRDYIDLLLNTQINSKYNSLLISIFIIIKSVEYVLLKEHKLKKSDSALKKLIIKKNYDSIREIIHELYDFDYESMIEYQNLTNDFEFQQIFKHKKTAENSRKINYLNSSKSTTDFDFKNYDKKTFINKLTKLNFNSNSLKEKINTNLKKIKNNSNDFNNETAKNKISKIIMPSRIELYENKFSTLKKNKDNPSIFGNISPQILFVKKVVRSKQLSPSISMNNSNNASSNISFRKFRIGKVRNLKGVDISTKMNRNNMSNIIDRLSLTNSKSNYEINTYSKKNIQNLRNNSNTIILDNTIYNKKYPFETSRYSSQKELKCNPSIGVIITRNTIIPKNAEIKNIINNIEINNINETIFNNHNYTDRILLHNLKYSNINKKDKMRMSLMHSLEKVNKRNEIQKSQKSINKKIDFFEFYNSSANQDKKVNRFTKKCQRIKRIKNNEKVNEIGNIKYSINK